MSASASILLLMLAAAGLRCWHLNDVSLWYDEACSLKISQYSWAELWDAIQREAHPPLYYLLLRGWGSLFGFQPFAARALSVLCAILTVPAIWWTINRALPHHTGIEQSTGVACFFAALLFVVNPAQLQLDQEARPYALGVLLTVLLAGMLLQATASPQCRRYWLGAGILAAALSMTHYHGLLILLAGGAFLLMEFVAAGMTNSQGHPANRFQLLGLGTLLSFGIVVAVWIPWVPTFLFQVERVNHQIWTPPLSVDYLTQMIGQALTEGRGTAIVGWLAGLLATIWLWLAVAVGAFYGRPGRLLACMALLPIAASTFYGLTNRNILEVRYLLFAQTSVLLSFALIAGSRKQSALTRAIILVPVVWSLFWCGQAVTERAAVSRHPGVQGAIAVLNAEREDATPIAVESPILYVIAWNYLDQRAGAFCDSQIDLKGDLLRGPALQPDELLSLKTSELVQLPAIWVVDEEPELVTDPQGGLHRLLGKSHRLTSERHFEEAYGYIRGVTIREYHRRTNAGPANRLAERVALEPQ